MCVLYFSLSCTYLSCFLSSEKKKNQFNFCSAQKSKLQARDIFCCDASLQPPGVRLRKLKRLAVQFNPKDAVFCAIGSTFELQAD